MNKIKVYRVLGGILSVYGVISYLVYIAGSIVIIDVMEKAIFSTIVSAIGLFVFNVFLWFGLILLWRADKKENPNQKSKWLRFIIVYIILSSIIIITGIAFLILIKMIR